MPEMPLVLVAFAVGLSNSTMVQSGPTDVQSQIIKSGIHDPPSGFGNDWRGNTHEVRWQTMLVSRRVGCCSNKSWRGFSLFARSKTSWNFLPRFIGRRSCKTWSRPRIWVGAHDGYIRSRLRVDNDWPHCVQKGSPSFTRAPQVRHTKAAPPDGKNNVTIFSLNITSSRSFGDILVRAR